MAGPALMRIGLNIVRTSSLIIPAMRALFVVLVFMFSLSGHSGAAPPEAKPSANSKAEIQQPDGTQNNPLFVRRKETDDDKAANTDEVKDRKENLVIQTKAFKVAADALKVTKGASDAATRAVTVGIVMAIIAVLQAFMFGWQLLVMRESNKTAADAASSALKSVGLTEKQFIASHRPWIKVGIKLTSNLIRDSAGGWKIEVSFKMKNVGSTVAQNVYPNPWIYAGEGFVDEIKNFQLKRAAEFKPIVDTSTAGYTIFPGQSFTVPVVIHVTKADAEDPILTHAEMGFGDCLPRLFIVGSAHYKSTIGELPHRTGFIRSLGYIDATRDEGVLIPKQDNVSRDKLFLGSHICGDGYID